MGATGAAGAATVAGTEGEETAVVIARVVVMATAKVMA